MHNRDKIPSNGPGTRPSREVREALRLIEARYAEPLTLRTLARAIGCSREHLARRFRRETGMTVHRHLVHVRVTRAAHEVLQGDKIEAVMLGVGFRGKRNFYRQFRARFGTTPGAYRSAPRDPTCDAHRDISRPERLPPQLRGPHSGPDATHEEARPLIPAQPSPRSPAVIRPSLR